MQKETDAIAMRHSTVGHIPTPGTRQGPGQRKRKGAVYTCPRHPEIVQGKPGTCPKCGMELEPRQMASEEEESPELKSRTRRFWVSLALTIPVFGIAMADMVPGLSLHRLLGAAVVNWLQLALASPVVLWGGWPELHDTAVADGFSVRDGG